MRPITVLIIMFGIGLSAWQIALATARATYTSGAKTTMEDKIRMVVLALLGGFVYFGTFPTMVSKYTWSAQGAYIVGLGLLIYIAWWAAQTCDTGGELRGFLFLGLIVSIVTLAPASLVRAASDDKAFGAVAFGIPLALIFALPVFIIAEYIRGKAKAESRALGGSTKPKKDVETIYMGLVGLAVGLFVLICGWQVRDVIVAQPDATRSGSIDVEVTQPTEAAIVADVPDTSVIDDLIIEEPIVEVTETEDPASDVEVPWYDFQNDYLQDDDNADNDFNFGVNNYSKKLKAKQADQLFRTILMVDPAIGAGDICYADAILGTRLLGKFYDEYKADDAMINGAKEKYMADVDLYDRTLEAFFATLDSAVKVRVVTIKSQNETVKDQMFMSPGRMTVAGVPDVIVMETAEAEGHYLQYEFVRKGLVLKLNYRIECGFQPCNVAEVLNVTVQKQSTPKASYTPKSTPTGTTPTPNPTPTPTPTPNPTPKKSVTPSTESSKTPTDDSTAKPTEKSVVPTTPTTTTPTPTDNTPSAPVYVPSYTPPAPSPTPVITNPKDPTKGTDVGGNDTTGPGPDTNNGVGAQYSTEDLPTNSNHMDLPTYQEDMQENKEANETTREQGDPNTVTYNPPASEYGNEVVNDDNAEKGTGNGGIDTLTPTDPGTTITDEDTGKTTNPGGEPEWGEWEGPGL